MLEIGTFIYGRYKIDRALDPGGMSNIYIGHDAKGQVYCFKEARDDADSVESLKEEAEIMSQIKHPGVPRFHEAFEWRGHYIIVMEWIPGITFAQLAAKGPVSEKDVRGWICQICDILSYLHSRPKPIIHRDIKPSNIIVRPDGTVALIDFGIAREFKTGKIGDTRGLGTKGYAAPEQYGGMGQTDARTDIYSLGATIFYLLSGKNPMDVQQEFPMVRKINPNISAEMENIICKCTKTKPIERYQNAGLLADDINMMNTSEKGISMHPVVSFALGIAGAALLVYEIVSGSPHSSVLVIGAILLLTSVFCAVISFMRRKRSASAQKDSKKNVSYLQKRDSFGTGNVSGKDSGSMKKGPVPGVIVEDAIMSLATSDWVLVIGQDQNLS